MLTFESVTETWFVVEFKPIGMVCVVKLLLPLVKTDTCPQDIGTLYTEFTVIELGMFVEVV